MKTKKDLEIELKAAQKEIKRLNAQKVIDILANFLTAAKIENEKDSCDLYDDYLSIYLYSEGKNTRYTIGISFSETGAIEGIRMFKCKKLKGYDEENDDQCGWSSRDLQENNNQREQAKSEPGATFAANNWHVKFPE